MIDISSIIGGVGNALDKLFTSDDERNKAKIALEQLRQQPHLLQALINQAEASNKSMFVAGWRPFVGWICGIALAFQFLIDPILRACHVNMPALDYPSLMTLLLSMLGLGGMRSFDKLKGTTMTFGQPVLPPPAQTTHEKR